MTRIRPPHTFEPRTLINISSSRSIGLLINQPTMADNDDDDLDAFFDDVENAVKEVQEEEKADDIAKNNDTSQSHETKTTTQDVADNEREEHQRPAKRVKAREIYRGIVRTSYFYMHLHCPLLALHHLQQRHSIMQFHLLHLHHQPTTTIAMLSNHHHHYHQIQMHNPIHPRNHTSVPRRARHGPIQH